MGRGWCARHYHKWYRYGDPLGGQPDEKPPEPVPHRKPPQITAEEGYRVLRPGQGWSIEWQAKQETQLMEIAQTHHVEIIKVNKNLYRVTVPTR